MRRLINVKFIKKNVYNRARSFREHYLPNLGSFRDMQLRFRSPLLNLADGYKRRLAYNFIQRYERKKLKKKTIYRFLDVSVDIAGEMQRNGHFALASSAAIGIPVKYGLGSGSLRFFEFVSILWERLEKRSDTRDGNDRGSNEQGFLVEKEKWGFGFNKFFLKKKRRKRGDPLGGKENIFFER